MTTKQNEDEKYRAYERIPSYTLKEELDNQLQAFQCEIMNIIEKDASSSWAEAHIDDWVDNKLKGSKDNQTYIKARREAVMRLEDCFFKYFYYGMTTAKMKSPLDVEEWQKKYLD